MSRNTAELEKLLESANLENRLFRMMANQIPNFSVIIFDTKMKYHLAEGAALKDAGYDSKKMVGASIDKVLEEDAVKMLKPLYQKTLNGESSEFELESNSKHYASKFLPIRDNNNHITHGMIVVFDVTKQKEALVEVEKANIAKTTFIANLSHEIRTPMNGILGLTDILSEIPNENPEVSDILKTIKNCGKSLLELLDDILSYAKLDQVKTSLDQTPANINDLVTQVYQIFKPTADEKNLSFEMEINLSSSKKYIVDQIKLKQVLMNIVGNAIKFTQVGNVRIRVYPVSAPSQAVDEKIEFEIIDSGIGVAQEDQKRIFEAFTQADTSKTKNFAGTGLGLTISKKIIDLMSGTISLDSEKGKGSSFKFQIKANSTEAGASATPNQNQPVSEENKDKNINHKKRVLVAEDNYINQMVIKNYLKKLGYTADIAENGVEALKLLKNSTYSIIFMDCNMPEMDGYICTKKIKEKYGISAPPIIAVTANSTTENRNKCAEAGMDDFIKKPYTKDDLVNAIKLGLRRTCNLSSQLNCKSYI
ncbi:MAG: response regulator [Oligoflexales bacterium]